MENAATRVAAHRWFFPAAALYAAVAVPASVGAMLGIMPALPGLASAAGHAHELLFGFALAAVAGNQLGPAAPRTLAALFLLWLGARAAFLAAPASVAAALANAAFAALLAAQLAPRMRGVARKLRNRALPATVVALCASVIAFEATVHAGAAAAQGRVLVVAVLLLSLLMLFMGGRIIAPAAAGQLYRQGVVMGPRVQPRMEGAIVASMLLAALAAACAHDAAAAALVLAAAGVAAVRMARWRLGRLRDRPDIMALAAGYAWLVAGLAAVGLALTGHAHMATALHAITVGAVGTLTVNVMALTWLRLARRDPARARLPMAATLLIAAATALRLLADAVDARGALLACAAGCWSAAFVALLLLFATTPQPPR